MILVLGKLMLDGRKTTVNLNVTWTNLDNSGYLVQAQGQWRSGIFELYQCGCSNLVITPAFDAISMKQLASQY